MIGNETTDAISHNNNNSNNTRSTTTTTTIVQKRHFGSGRQRNSSKTSSSYGPVLRNEGPSSRKTWRDDNIYQHIIEREAQDEKNFGSRILQDPADDDNDDDNDDDDSVSSLPTPDGPRMRNAKVLSSRDRTTWRDDNLYQHIIEREKQDEKKNFGSRVLRDPADVDDDESVSSLPSSYGPRPRNAKVAPDSSRTSWRDDNLYTDMAERVEQRQEYLESVRFKEISKPLASFPTIKIQNDNDDPSSSSSTDNQKTWQDDGFYRYVIEKTERQELQQQQTTAANEAVPEWLVRFTNAELRYPISDNNNKNNHPTHSLDNENDSNSKKRKRKAKLNRTTTSTKQKNMIYPIPKLEIRHNAQRNVHRSIHKHKGTGHVILGVNGSGKSLFIKALLYNSNHNTQSNLSHWSTTSTTPNENDHQQRRNTEEQQQQSETEITTTTYANNPYLVDSSTLEFQSPNHNNEPLSIAYVSFESHQELLDEAAAASSSDVNDDATKTKPTTVWSVLTKPMGGGALSKGLEYLVVRFGLRALLTRDVTTLSTGEIRKVLLIRAIGQQPNMLLLDNAFDGLDTPSRKTLDDIITKTMRGFHKKDILVQGVNVKDVLFRNDITTQVILFTHRPEEIHDKISRVTFLQHPSTGIPSSTEFRSQRTGQQLLQESAGYEPLELGLLTTKQFARQTDHLIGIHDDPWYDTSLPSDEEITNVWWNQRPKEDVPDIGKEIVIARYLQIRNKQDTKNLISNLNWKIQYGERWWLSGLNGAGKSTLSRFITTTTASMNQSDTSPPLREKDETINDDESFLHVLLQPNDICYISTERHMSLSKLHHSGRDVINMLRTQSSKSGKASRGDEPSNETLKNILRWLNLPKSFLTRPFNELSQGEQKMLLIAGVLSYRPLLLMLDEPLQGLDIVNRHRVLGVVDRICSVTNISLIYVTHHHDDLIPALTHVLHLVGGKSLFKGTIETFDCHNTLWSNKIKPTPEDQRDEDYHAQVFDVKKKRKRRVW